MPIHGPVAHAPGSENPNPCFLTPAPSLPMNILVIAGFLGAGKTTLLLGVARRLVDSGLTRIAIVENEAGKVGVDDQLVQQTGLNVREIFGGCVCCSLGPSLLMGLKQIEEQVKPELVILEPSGVAAPDQIKQLLEHYDGNIERIQLLVMFDVERFAAISHVARPMVEASIRCADVVIINKVDLAKDGQIADLVDAITQHRADVPILPMSAADGQGLDQLIEHIHSPAARGLASPTAHEHEHHHHHPGEPIAEARKIEQTFNPPRRAGELVAALQSAMQTIARDIAQHDGAVIGHVKAALVADGLTAVLRTTSADRQPSLDGSLPETLTHTVLTLNALAYAMPPQVLRELVDRALDDGGLVAVG
jgi:G3E family GTPase